MFGPGLSIMSKLTQFIAVFSDMSGVFLWCVNRVFQAASSLLYLFHICSEIIDCERRSGAVNKGIGDAGSTADLRTLRSAIVCLGLGLLLMQAT